MPKVVTPLTDTKVRQAKPKDKVYWVSDGGGLYLRVTPDGSKFWAARPTVNGKRTTLHLGKYPEMSLAQARQANQVTDGGRLPMPEPEPDPKEADNAASFTAVSEAWIAHKQQGWSKKSYDNAIHVIRNKLQPKVGHLDMRTLRTSDVLEVVREIAAETPVYGRKAVTYLNGIVEQAILAGLRGEDQVIRTKGMLPTYRGGHVPAITKERSVGDLMRAIYNYEGAVTRAALKLAAWTALRPGIIASAKWSEIDLARAEWHVDAFEEDGRRRMKTRHDHIVSLPTQAVEMLEEMWEISGGSVYVFPPSGRRKNVHLSRDTLSKALRLMGFKGQHATHGFRAMLRTLARERLGVDPDVLEAQLAHAKGDEVQAAYDRTTFGETRRRVMQEWADYLDRHRLSED